MADVESQLRELREALKPFARAWRLAEKRYDAPSSRRSFVIETIGLRDFRQAARTLEKQRD